MKRLLMIIGLLLCTSLTFSQEVYGTIEKEQVRLVVSTKQLKDKEYQVLFEFTNKSDKVIYLLDVSVNNTNVISTNEVFLNLINIYDDPLSYPKLKIPLIEIRQGESHIITKNKELSDEKINKIIAQVELFEPSQIRGYSKFKKVKKQFCKSLENNNPEISILHYTEINSHKRITFVL